MASTSSYASTFVTHEVSVRGDSLERIETIMQRKQLSLLKTLPSHQWSLIEQGQPFVTEIVIAEKKGLSKRAEKRPGMKERVPSAGARRR